MISSPRAALVAVGIVTLACGGSNDVARPPETGRTSVALGAGRPSLSVVERQGDARGAVAIAVTTHGIAVDRGAMVAVALAALVEERLAVRGMVDTAAIGIWNGWRLRALVASPAEGAKLVDAAREAMLTPVASNDPALGAVARKVGALARRPLPDRALVDVARCTGEAYGTGEQGAPSPPELEMWRRSAHGLGRVAIATAGEASLVDAVATALAHSPAWPVGAAIAPSPWPAPDARPVVYDASGDIPPGAARIVVTARTTVPERAVAAASALGDLRGPLASRLAALDAPARLRSVLATAHVDGGCLAATIDLAARDLASDAAARIATATVLARQELAVEVADVMMPAGLRRALAQRASDPREAAETAAWWGLAGSGGGGDDLRLGLMIGLAAARDAGEPATTSGSDPPVRSGRTTSALGDAIRAEVDRAAMAWQVPVVEARTRIEKGQGQAWVLLASPCGTLPEASHDAGTSAAVAMAAAMQAGEGPGDGHIEPFVTTEGVGVLAHGPARAGESPQAHARRLADLAGRAFAADALDGTRVTRARTALLARASEVDARMLGALGAALAQNHPSWVDPLGTSFGLGSASDDSVAMRAAAIRTGPLRVAVLANADSAQAEAAVRAVDRWVARRPDEARACPPVPTLATTRAGTYAVDVPAGAPSEALLAIPLAPGDQAARTAAAWIAAALDGNDGLLARAVGGLVQGNPYDTALARAWSAAVIGAPRSPALVVRLAAADTSLDAVVANARALLDRLRQGALQEEDRVRAASALARAAVTASLDPRARVIDLWRADPASGAAAGGQPGPSLDALRAFAAAVLLDDSLVIVAGRPSIGRESRGAGRD
jgi:hypothetical protein